VQKYVGNLEKALKMSISDLNPANQISRSSVEEIFSGNKIRIVS